MQTEIAEILNNMREENQRNIENFEKVLSGINTKLEAMEEDDEAVELVRFYIAELKKAMEDRFNASMIKYDAFEASFDGIISAQSELAKTSELKDLFGVFSAHNEAFMAEISSQKNLLDVLDEKLSQIDEKSVGKDELSSMVQDVSLDLSVLGENIQKSFLQLEDEIKAFDVSESFVELNQAVNELKQVSYQASFDEINEVLTNIQDNIPDLSAFSSDIKENDDNNYNALKDYIEEVSSNLNSLMDSTSVLKTDTVINREKLCELTECLNKFEPVDYSYDLQQISSKLDDLTGENVSISSDIQEKFENIKELVESLDNSDAVKLQFESFERAFSQILTTEDFSHFKGEFLEFIQKIVDNSNVLYENSNALKSQLSEGVEEVQAKLTDLLVNVQYLRDVSSQNSYEFLDNVKQCVNDAVEKLNSNSEINFGDLKGSFENIMSEISEIKDDFAQKNDTNVFNISSGFDNIKVSLENVVSALHSMGATNESLSAVDEKINRLNDVISALSSDLLLKQDEIVQHIKDANDVHVSHIKSVSENIDGIKGYIDESVECIKNYIAELEVSANTIKASGDEKLNQKLLDLESTFVQSSNEYEQKMELLQAKITEFAHIVENSNSDTEGKIASSLEEIQTIKSELTALNDGLKSSKVSVDEKFAETVSLIDAGIENIIFNITNLTDSVVNGVGNSLKENISSVDEKFDNLSEILNELKNQHTLNNVDLIQDIEDKVTALKDELGLVNSDIASALECKSEDIIRALEPVKTGIDEFIGFDFEKVLSDLKSQMELAFMNFSADITNEFTSNSEAISKLEQAFKETFNKLSQIEDDVAEKVQNSIELLNVNLESSLREVKNLDAKVDEINCKLDIAFSNKSDEKFNDRFDEISNKLDIVVSDTSVEELNDRFDEVLENVDVVNGNINDALKNVQLVDNKCNELSKDVGGINGRFDEILEKGDSISKNLSLTDVKVSDMISALHAKVDALAEGNSDFDILEEIDCIKDIIFEQRKFFEVSSDEKASAIDKYLRDVLLKLDSVDLEKNADDIKESILNALVSLVDQISFVEETEEIKDFVEERTSEINKNLIEVQNQIKQLTNPSDDFDYKYSLQDVETDIAKLRLAISNMSGNDFSDVNDEIKKIVDAVEGLENTLTQEQIVDLKSDIEKLSEDIVSISSRTNKLLLNSDESYKALNDGLNNFSNIIYKLEDRLNSDISERIERKVDSIHSLAVEADNANKVSHQVMMYLGEWIDSAGESISNIVEKTSEIDSIKEDIQQLKEAIPEKSEILNAIEKKFEQQEERLDRLEMKLEKVLSTLEEKDDMVLNRKVDNIENLLSGLGKNIEKLASYVDEE